MPMQNLNQQGRLEIHGTMEMVTLIVPVLVPHGANHHIPPRQAMRCVAGRGVQRVNFFRLHHSKQRWFPRVLELWKSRVKLGLGASYEDGDESCHRLDSHVHPPTLPTSKV